MKKEKRIMGILRELSKVRGIHSAGRAQGLDLL